MMFGLPLVFAAPIVLAALTALPALWWLLRVTPPRPRRVPFPPLKIVQDLFPQEKSPARTPWWLLALRMVAAALIILAASGPVWQPTAIPEAATRGPLLMMIDDGAGVAHDWPARLALANARLQAADRAGRSVALLPASARVTELNAATPREALVALNALSPLPFVPDRAGQGAAIAAFLDRHRDAEIAWIADSSALPGVATPAALLGELAGRHPVTVHLTPRATALGLAAVANRADGLAAAIVRPEPNGRDEVNLIASDAKGLVVGTTRANFAVGATGTEAVFNLPLEIRNAVTRIEIADGRAAIAVALVDERGRRRRVGVVSGASSDIAQPLLSPTYYVTRALSPYAEVREARGAASDAIGRFLDEQASVIILADIGSLDAAITERLTRFVQEGGVLVRFAGTRLAAGGDNLVPVRLRRGGRSLGGSLSWDTPRTLAPFPETSPLAGLTPPSEVAVRRQILAEPDSDLNARTWAALADGTPIVTGERRGEGHIVLFHVTADPGWSSLPLSGLFVDVLRRIVNMSALRAEASNAPAGGAEAAVSPRVLLDGYGSPGTPGANARPISRDFDARASGEHPAGFYGPVENQIAVNVLRPGDRLVMADFASLKARLAPIVSGDSIDLRGWLLAGAILLVTLDTLALAALGGLRLTTQSRRKVSQFSAGASAMTVALLVGWLVLPEHAKAQTQTSPTGLQQISQKDMEAAFATRLAYVTTGDAGVDATTRAGMIGLTQALANRTAMEPGEPAAIDPARDELSVYPLIYWPVVAGRPLPSEEALRRIDAFMKNGGTIIFDTRDAASVGAAGQASPATLQLRRMLATLDIPELEPLPRDHVLTKAFYLLDELPGRYATGRTWIEALPPAPDGEARPARSGDGISPILITGNDLASAWAIDRNGAPLYPVSGSERQREFAIRGGINLMMYALTGNYKTDQVHIGPLLERLGQ